MNNALYNIKNGEYNRFCEEQPHNEQCECCDQQCCPCEPSESTELVQSDWNQKDTTLPDYIKHKPTIPTKTSDLTNDSGFITDISGKQDIIEDLDDIRAGASAGATAYQKPATGIPITDLTSAAQVSLGKADTALQTETDPTVPAWAKTQNKPSYNAGEVGALPSTTKYGASIDMSMNTTDYKLTLSLKDQDGTVLNSKVVDFPVESMVVNATYDNTNKKIILTLQNGNTIDVPLGDLVNGLQSEITSLNMLDADLVDDTTSAHKFVTAQEKQTWNNKSDFSGSYNDLSNKPTIPDAQIQSDWNQSDNTKKDFIKNKPTIPDVTGKADKVSGATNGNFAALDSNGNLTDSGHKHSDYLTSHQDLSNYVQKSQTAGLLKNDGTVDTTQYTTNIGTITGITMNGQSKGTSGNVDLGTVVTDVSGKENITPIEAVASGTTAITAQANKYYEVAGTVSSLTVTLPTPTTNTEVTMVVVHLTVGANPTILVTSSATVAYSAAYAVVANKEYELSCLYNGSKWIVSSMEVAV